MRQSMREDKLAAIDRAVARKAQDQSRASGGGFLIPAIVLTLFCFLAGPILVVVTIVLTKTYLM